MVAEDVVTFPSNPVDWPGKREVVVIFEIEVVLLVFPVTVCEVVSPSSGPTAPPILATFAEAPDPSVLVLSKYK
jgi:hypothetical protein